ncbi:MAG: hypothetical protein A2Y62_05150 [Candidatus Fischerbacteria bacterium RBG_13_37_8]|uniref:ABC transporter ATP-binding protein n=1 Tax=Candidatus Fischerbacteria bacterium RBG_13_37_8 TaxID=1817863 RepID=A0A1F5V8I0_9BACT|nr:MAG: hypothetical protein A2Y62_05150 [Candidatus Fischerbacteria bacterium RBG_13_37_8]
MSRLYKLTIFKEFSPISLFYKENKKIILTGSLFVLLSSSMSIVSPWILKIAIDDLKIAISIKQLGFYAALIIIVTAIHGIFRYKMRKILISLSRIFEYQLHNKIYHHLLYLPQSFFDKGYTGEVMSKITNDVHAVRMVAGPAFMYLLNTIFTAVFSVIMMLAINPKLTVLTLIPLPIISISIAKIGKKIRYHFTKVQETFSEMSVKTQENLSGIREIKVFAREEKEINEFQKINKSYIEHNKKLLSIYTLMHPFFVLLIGLSTLIILWVGGKYVIDNKISLGSFVAFNSYLLLLAWPAVAFGWIINIVQRGAASMKRINELTAEKTNQKYLKNSNISDRHKGTETHRHIVFETIEKFFPGNALSSMNKKSDTSISLEISQVNFSYNSHPILNNISFCIHPGETIAITGPTASGKSTLFKLILRRYAYQKGIVRFANIPLEDIPLQEWLSLIGYVPQDAFLFSDSIENNINLGLEIFDDDYMKQCLKIACIEQEIMQLSHDTKTILGERGITLSGGQKQRLSIARALMKKPFFLLLDDPFSQIDIETEHQLWNKLSSYPYAPIRIISSQRIHSIRNADTILVIDNGSIAEKGNHSTLLNMKGLYYSLFQKQLIEQIIKE